MSPAARLVPMLLLLAACADAPTAPEARQIPSLARAPEAARPAPDVSCTGRPSSTGGFLVTVSWSHFPVNRIVLFKQTVPTASHDVTLKGQKQKGRYEVDLDFGPHVVFLVDRKGALQIQGTCTNS